MKFGGWPPTRGARDVHYFFAVSTEIASVVLGVSPATLKREWATARAWMRRELKKDAAK
jgi:hypothetical protein